ncbi:MAG: tyrosine-type recombinase/integrase [Bacteroidia bacterium]
MLEGSFHQYLQVERNYSPHTLLAYTQDLRAFDAFLKEHYSQSLFEEAGAKSVTHRTIRVWMGELMEAGAGNRTVGRKVASLSTYFKWLRKTGICDQNPVSKVTTPKFEKKLPSFLKHDSIDQLFQGIEFEDSFEGWRDKALLELFYSCGFRRSELIGLLFHNIDFANATVKVMGKGRKERVVPLGSHAARAMKGYMKACDEKGLDYRGTFFLRPEGEPLYDRLVHRIVDKYLKQVSSLSKTSPHVLRHTFATHLLDRGADLNAIKEMLGHSSLAATQVYVHNSISKLKDVYSKAHPKA